MKIVADSHIPFIHEYFGSYGELVLKPGRAIANDDLQNADMLIVRSITQVNPALLQDSSVKFVGSVTAGTDHIDLDYLQAANIICETAAGFNSPPVADYVVAIIAALQQQQVLAEKNLRAAVIGVGHVGQLVVDRLRFLGIDVILSDPIRAMHEKEFNSVSLAEISDVDLILLHVPLTKSGAYPTYHFIDETFLRRQKKGCALINASRGAVISSQALLAAGEQLLWCFDVWEHEPHIDKTILAKSIIATPHIAGYSVQSKIRGIDMIYRKACEYHMIKPQPISPIEMPVQALTFADIPHRWQEIVLGVFNPMVMTCMMMSSLLPSEQYAHVFDNMRNHFNYRHEFAFTKLLGVNVSSEDEALLQHLGFTL